MVCCNSAELKVASADIKCQPYSLQHFCRVRVMNILQQSPDMKRGFSTIRTVVQKGELVFKGKKKKTKQKPAFHFDNNSFCL